MTSSTFRLSRIPSSADSLLRPTSRKVGLTFLSIEQVANILNLSPRTIHRLIADGKLKRHVFSRAVRISSDDLYAYAAQSRE